MCTKIDKYARALTLTHTRIPTHYWPLLLLLLHSRCGLGKFYYFIYYYYYCKFESCVCGQIAGVAASNALCLLPVLHARACTHTTHHRRRSPSHDHTPNYTPNRSQSFINTKRDTQFIFLLLSFRSLIRSLRFQVKRRSSHFALHIFFVVLLPSILAIVCTHSQHRSESFVWNSSRRSSSESNACACVFGGRKNCTHLFRGYKRHNYVSVYAQIHYKIAEHIAASLLRLSLLLFGCDAEWSWPTY